MLRLREKLKYMFLVGLLAFAGFMLGNMNNDTKAELGADTIDELTVRKLTVLEDLTVIADNGEPRVVISWNELNGQVSCYGPGGMDVAHRAALLVGQLGGIAGVTDRNASGASLTIGLEGGGVTIFPIEGALAGKGGAALGIDKGDGFVSTIDRFGERRALGGEE